MTDKLHDAIVWAALDEINITVIIAHAREDGAIGESYRSEFEDALAKLNRALALDRDEINAILLKAAGEDRG
jgi:hypothetical protein